MVFQLHHNFPWPHSFPAPIMYCSCRLAHLANFSLTHATIPTTTILIRTVNPTVLAAASTIFTTAATMVVATVATAAATISVT